VIKIKPEKAGGKDKLETTGDKDKIETTGDKDKTRNYLIARVKCLC
jgi:hypothetical protein